MYYRELNIVYVFVLKWFYKHFKLFVRFKILIALAAVKLKFKKSYQIRLVIIILLLNSMMDQSTVYCINCINKHNRERIIDHVMHFLRRRLHRMQVKRPSNTQNLWTKIIITTYFWYFSAIITKENILSTKTECFWKSQMLFARGSVYKQLFLNLYLLSWARHNKSI